MMQIDSVTDAVINRLVTAIARASTASPVIAPIIISAGTSLSPAIAVPRATRLWAMALPPTWTASEISYQINFNGDAWYEPVNYNTGAPLVETAPGLGGTAFLTSSFALLRCSSIRVRSGSAAAPIAQQADQASIFAAQFTNDLLRES
jgi:hypothetical protein